MISVISWEIEARNLGSTKQNKLYKDYPPIFCSPRAFYFWFVCFFESGFLRVNAGYPGTHFEEQAGLELTEIHLCWDQWCVLPQPSSLNASSPLARWVVVCTNTQEAEAGRSL